MTIQIEQHPLVGRFVRITWREGTLLPIKPQVYRIVDVEFTVDFPPRVRLEGFGWTMRLDGGGDWRGPEGPVEFAELVGDEAAVSQQQEQTL